MLSLSVLSSRGWIKAGGEMGCKVTGQAAMRGPWPKAQARAPRGEFLGFRVRAHDIHAPTSPRLNCRDTGGSLKTRMCKIQHASLARIKSWQHGRVVKASDSNPFPKTGLSAISDGVSRVGSNPAVVGTRMWLILFCPFFLSFGWSVWIGRGPHRSFD